MPISINVDDNVEEVRRRMTEAGKSYVFATSKALSDLAWKVVAGQRKAMQAAFDRPRAWTMNSLTVERGTKAAPTATVRQKPGAGDYVATNVFGGQRRDQKAEDLLQAKFGGLAAAIPGRGARLDAFGNWLRTAEAKRALGAVLAQPTAPTPVKRGSRRREFFVPTDGSDLSPGVYARTGERGPVKMLLAFVKARPTYRKLVPWFETAQATVRTEFAATFKAVLGSLSPRS